MLGLTELYLNDTYLEFLPANFGRLVNLRILELRENALITLPKSMNRLESLTRLDIGQNEFTELVSYPMAVIRVGHFFPEKLQSGHLVSMARFSESR